MMDHGIPITAKDPDCQHKESMRWKYATCNCLECIDLDRLYAAWSEWQSDLFSNSDEEQ